MGTHITGGGTPIPVAPSLDAALTTVRVPQGEARSGRVFLLSGLAVIVAALAALAARLLIALIGLITNLSFFGRVSTAFTSPADNHLGLWVMIVPVIGGLCVGLMARYGSPAI